MDTLNRAIFILINATPASALWLIKLAQFIAKDLILIVPILNVLLWLWGKKEQMHFQRRLLLKANMALLYALIISACVSHLLPYPRPFAAGFGHQFLNHIANASYPSDHGTIIFTFALAFICWHKRWSGLILLFIACAIAWARVYLGIHWPLDMLGGLLVGLLGCLASQLTWQFYGEKLLAHLNRAYHLLFAFIIRRGWIQY